MSARLSSERKVHNGRIAQPIAMQPEWHDLVMKYCAARRDHELRPWKFSQLVREAVEEFIVKHPVEGFRWLPPREEEPPVPAPEAAPEAAPSAPTE